jgi:hypothetical protein
MSSVSSAAKKLASKVRSVLKAITKEAWLVVAVLACIAIAAAIVLSLTWTDELAHEAGKTSLSVLAVSLFGALAALAVDRYKQRREDDAERRRTREKIEDEKAERREEQRRLEEIRREEAVQRQLDADRKEAADARLRQEEAWRRELEHVRDIRSREDALLRSLLQDTLRTYNRVKRTRRLLNAYTMSATGRSLRLDIYDSHMQELIDLQLMFEEFKRLTSVSADKRLGLPVLTRNFEVIEKYLNKVVDEYLENRHRVETNAVLPLEEFPRLSGLFHGKFPVEVKGTVDAGFELNVSTPIDEIVKKVQNALLEPLELPEVAYSIDAAPASARQR